MKRNFRNMLLRLTYKVQTPVPTPVEQTVTLHNCVGRTNDCGSLQGNSAM